MSDEARDQAGATLVVLRRRVDDHFEAAMQRSPEAMQCRVGCARCCHQRFGVFEVEAHRLRAALARLARHDPQKRERVRRQADDPDAMHHCALLVDDRCTVYEQRPMICRTHGLPTLVRDPEGGASLQGCPLNFTTEDPPTASVLDLQAVNAPLSVMAQMWDGQGARVELAELARAADVLDEA
ncbi:MAG: YkgJ family cysteine cluster protein [Myxococcota bacterium]